MIDKDIAREKLQYKSDFSLLFFGLIRQYKGLDILLSAINNIDENLKDNFECMIVGESYENINHYKSILKENVSANILWVNDYVSDDKDNFDYIMGVVFLN